MTSLAALPNFLLHLLVGVALLVGGVWAFVRLTPHDELRLVAAGNAGAAIKLAGALAGLALPVSASIRASANLLDAVVWAVIAVLAQLAAFVVVTRLLPDWRAAMESRGETAGAILHAGAAIALGLVNAACLTP